jgi:hypothetical protein
MDGHTESTNEAKNPMVNILMTPGTALNVFSCLGFIKLCNQVRGKQINGDNKSSGEK